MPPEDPGVGDDVRVHIATLDTAAATELCVRTAHRFAGHPFDLVVGDSGSTDGSNAMLRRLEAGGWLHLDVAPEGRRHAQWLDHWMQECPARYAVFVDSDMEFLTDGWLRDLVDVARRDGAAMVTSRVQHLVDHDHVDKDGAPRRWAPRPTPWLMLVDLAQVRGRVDAGFGFRVTDDPERPGGKVAYDTGAAFFEAVQRLGLAWAEMPEGWDCCYRHFGGMTWVRTRRISRARRAKLALKSLVIRLHLLRARLSARRPAGDAG